MGNVASFRENGEGRLLSLWVGNIGPYDLDDGKILAIDRGGVRRRSAKSIPGRRNNLSKALRQVPTWPV